MEGTTFLGVPMSQTWDDLRLYERVLNAHPELNSVIELGTGQGGLSYFLHAQAVARGQVFHTFDIVRPDEHVPGWKRLDVFKDAALVERYFHRPALIVCDNGNKPLELETYAPRMLLGDLVAVHDWGTEVYEDDVPTGLTPIHKDWCDSMTRVFAATG